MRAPSSSHFLSLPLAFPLCSPTLILSASLPTSSTPPHSLSLSHSLLDAFSHLAIGLPRRFKRWARTYDVIGYRISAGFPIGRSPRTVAAPARQLRLICYVKTSIASIPSLVPPSGARPLAQPPSTLPYPARLPPTSPGHPFDGPRHTATAPNGFRL